MTKVRIRYFYDVLIHKESCEVIEMARPDNCRDHSGCVADIEHLQESDKQQWECLHSISARINVVLGGVAVSCIMLAINLIIKKV